MKPILHHLKENWITYGLDTIVVTVGILGAFALNNWNEERVARSVENVVLKQLESDFTENMESINICIKSHNRDLEHCKFTMKYLGSKAVLPDSTVIKKFRYIQYTRFNQVYNSANLALTSKYFDVLKSLKLKTALSTFPSKSARYFIDEQEAIDNAKSQRVMYAKYISLTDVMKSKNAHSTHPSRHMAWLRDLQHQNIVLGRILVINNYCLKELALIKEENQKVLDMIQSELKRFH